MERELKIREALAKKPEIVDLAKEPDAKNIVRIGKHAARLPKADELPVVEA